MISRQGILGMLKPVGHAELVDVIISFVIAKQLAFPVDAYFPPSNFVNHH
jgi:hypothetical protein